MAIKVTEFEPPQKKASEFPKLMRGITGTVYLMQTESVGIALTSKTATLGRTYYELGSEKFEDFEGSIALQNE